MDSAQRSGRYRRGVHDARLVLPDGVAPSLTGLYRWEAYWLSNVSDRLDDYVADMDLAGIQHTSERLGWDRVLRNIGWRRAGYSHEKMRR